MTFVFKSFQALRLGMIRRAEELAADFVRENSLPIGALLLHAIYRRLDQPLAARQALKVGVEVSVENKKISSLKILYLNLLDFESKISDFDSNFRHI